jgi:transmembrane sensor
MPTKDYLKLLLEKYLKGKCTPDEAQMLWQWIYLLDLRDQQELEAAEEETIRGHLHDRIFNHVRQSSLMGVTDQYSFPIKKRPPGRWAIAASVAAIILLGATTLYYFQHSPHPASSRASLATLIVNDGPAAKTVYLPDSTEVTLNRSASLELGQAYNGKNRVVRLTGEAYFVTHHDPARPFIVQTGSIETRTLGTAFNIESYPLESEIRVSLLQGKVQVFMDSSANGSTGDHSRAIDKDTLYSALLDPGQMVRYDVTGKRLSRPLPIAAADVLAWIRGSLVFNDIPLAEALNRVGDHYHIYLRYHPEQMIGKRVTAVFDNKTSWEGALSNILFPHSMQYIKRDSLIFIK